MSKAPGNDRVSVRRNGVIVMGKRPPVLTGAQARVARGLLGWSQTKLAEVARVSVTVVRDVEADRAVSANMLLRILGAFGRAQVEFPAGAEPRLRA